MGKGLAAPTQVPLSRRRNRTTRPKPDKSRRETDSSGPAAQEAKLLRRREYERARSKSPERREYNRRLAQGTAAEGQGTRPSAGTAASPRSCSQTRCPACTEATGSPAGAATLGGEQRPKLRRQRRKAVYYREQAGLGHRGVFGPSPEDSSNILRAEVHSGTVGPPQQQVCYTAQDSPTNER